MDTDDQYRGYTVSGWALTLAGCILWAYGYFVGGSPPLLNWTGFAPHWISDYLPNRQSEIGLLLSLVGSIPIYYVQIKTAQRDQAQ